MTSFPFTKIRKEKDIDPTAEHCIYVYIGAGKKKPRHILLYSYSGFWMDNSLSCHNH